MPIIIGGPWVSLLVCAYINIGGCFDSIGDALVVGGG